MSNFNNHDYYTAGQRYIEYELAHDAADAYAERTRAEPARSSTRSRRSARFSTALSLLILLPLYIYLPVWTTKQHFRLPEPKVEQYDMYSGLPQMSEKAILAHAKYLSEDIGFRTVGTREHALGDKYVHEQAKLIQAACQEAVKMAPTRRLECEVWRQEGSGTHRFDIMGKPVYKVYEKLSNIVLRISDGTRAGKAHALLLNAHVDSTAPSPGAADDAMSVGILLELARVFVHTPDWQPQHAISGIILSDTDFRQFQEYRNLTGLDMAVVGDSYLYHTRKDLVKHIQPGVAQHFAENVYAITKYLIDSPDSPLPKLAHSYTEPTSIYFSVIGRWFFLYSSDTAWLISGTMFAASLSMLLGTTDSNDVNLILQAILGVWGSLFGAVLAASVAASIMSRVFGAGMTWFSNEYSPFVLYGPPALAGALGAQYFLTARTSPTEARRFESATLQATHLFNIGSAMLLQVYNLGSSSLFTIFSLGSLCALLVNTFLNSMSRRVDWTNIHLTAYAVAQIIPLTVGTELAVGMMSIFVPLTGRMGEVAPVEHIIAVMTAVLGFFIFSLALPFVHRLRRSVLLSTIISISMASAMIMFAFALAASPFDAMHQKRMFVLHYEDLNTNEHHLHLAAADGAPGFSELVHDISKQFTQLFHQPVPVLMDDNNADWDIIYPFSQFLTPYKIPLPPAFGYQSPFVSSFTVKSVDDIYNYRTNTRSLKLVIKHPGVIWTALAFDAHVLNWSIDSPPEPRFTRHHIKQASFYGVNEWELHLTIAVPSGRPEKVRFDFMGIMEKGSWPGKKHDPQDGPAMMLFEDLDAYVRQHTGDAVDLMLLG
ncbi:hypothetical protein FRB99_001981, partial [Tulasnella sp. 403]